MPEESTDKGSSMQMKCPCCGEMISMSAKPAYGEGEGMEHDKGRDWESGFRESMSPRNDDQPEYS